MFSRYYRHGKAWLDIFLKSPVSEDPLTGKMVSGSKDCCNLNGRTVTIFSDNFDGKEVGKCVS